MANGSRTGDTQPLPRSALPAGCACRFAPSFGCRRLVTSNVGRRSQCAERETSEGSSRGIRQVQGWRLNVLSHTLASLQDGQFLPDPYDAPCIYVLRLDLERNLDPSVRAIPNQRDENGILYIGGHPSGRRTGRFNALIAACRRAEQYFATNGHARNDTSHGHPVAGCLTTGLLEAGFHLSDCILDLVKCEPQVDELELLIGYQEKFYHLPPWNTLRGGASAFLKTDVNADASASISGFDSKTLCQSLESAVFLVE